MKKNEKTKVVRVKVGEETHDPLLVEFQQAYKKAKGKVPAKHDIVLMMLDSVGVKWMKEQTKAFLKEAKQNI